MKEACETSAAIGQELAGAGPETDPQRNPEGALSEGGACVGGQPAAGAAEEAWVRDVGWVRTVVALADREVEPESEVNAEKEAFVGGGTLLIG